MGITAPSDVPVRQALPHSGATKRMGWLLQLVRLRTGSTEPPDSSPAPQDGPVRKPAAHPYVPRDRRWWLAATGFGLLHLSHPLTWRLDLPGAWFPPAAIGFLLVAWLGPRAALLVVADALLVALQAWLFGTRVPWGSDWPAWAGAVWDALLSGAEVWVAWWFYRRVAEGARRLVDP